MSVLARYMEAATSGYPLYAWTVTVAYYDYGSLDGVRAYFGGVTYSEGLGQAYFSTDGTKALSLRRYQTNSGGYALISSYNSSVPFSRSNFVRQSTKSFNWASAYAATNRDDNKIDEPVFTVSDDGTKFYILLMRPRSDVGLTHGKADYVLLQYDMSPAWDASSAVHVNSEYLDLYPYDHAPKAIRFNSTGTKLYCMSNAYYFGTTSPRNYMTSYTLSTPWVIKTATSDMSPSYPIVSTGSRGFSLYSGTLQWQNWKPDGTRYYVGENYGTGYNSTYSIKEWRLSTAWDQQTAEYYGRKSISWNAVSTFAKQWPWFKTDGTKFYIVNDNGWIFQWNLNTAWDITTLDLNSETYFNNGNTTNSIYFPGGGETSICFKPDGTKMYVGGYRSVSNPASDPGTTKANMFREYTLSPAWDIASATYQAEASTMGTYFSKGRISMTPDGVYYVYNYGDEMRWRKCNTAWSLSSLGTSGIFDDFYFDSAQTEQLTFYSDYWFVPDANNRIKSFRLNRSHVLMTFDNNTVSGNTGGVSPTGVTFPWPTAGFNGDDPLGGIGTGSSHERALDFSSDGLSLYTLRNDHDYGLYGGLKVAQYTLGSAYDYMDVTSVQYSDALSYLSNQRSGQFGSELYANSINIATWDSDNSAFITSEDGTVNKFEFTTAGDVTTLQQLETSTGIFSFKEYFRSTTGTGQMPLVWGNVKWHKDGTLMIVAEWIYNYSGPSTAYLHVFEASTPYDVTTLSHSYATTFDLSDHSANPLTNRYIFSDDGTKFYTLPSGQAQVKQFELSTPWNLESRDAGTVISLPYTNNFNDNLTSLQFLNDGQYLFVNSGGDYLERYTLTTPYDVSTAGSHTYGSWSGGPYGTVKDIVLDSTGKRFMAAFVNSWYNYNVQGFRLDTAMDPSAGISVSGSSIDLMNSLDPSGESRVDRLPWSADSMDVRFDGKKMYILSHNQGSVYQYGLS
jgi:hypothetical protein